MKTPVVLGWSGGKDSALALAELAASDEFEVVALLTTFTRVYDRVSMHGVKRDLIFQQAEQLALPLFESWIEKGANNDSYEAAMKASLSDLKAKGIDTVAFGDLYLEEIRQYRDRLVHKLDMKTLYPLWGKETCLLAHSFIAEGFRAVTCCIDSEQIPSSFCGKEFNTTFLQALPVNADPCGENGEFHTFVHDCPMMGSRIEIELGETRRDGQFMFRDLKLTKHQELIASGELK